MGSVIFNGNTYKTAGDLPTIGSRAPDLSLVGTDLANLSLANWAGKRKIMNIFPSIDTPVCARSVIAFDRLAEDHDDVVMLMISCDLPFAHKRFAEQHGLKRAVGLSSLRHAGFGENYGVQIEDGPLAGLYARAVVVLDENDTVVHRQLVETLSDEPDYEEAWRALGIKVDMDVVA